MKIRRFGIDPNAHILPPLVARAMHRAMRLHPAPMPDGPDTRVERALLSTQGCTLVAAPIPKVASRSVIGMFRDFGSGTLRVRRLRPDEVRAAFPDAFVFSFVRNPWARIHSCWKDKVDNAKSGGKLRILARFPGLRPFMPFEEFLEWLETEAGSDAHADRHWLSQVRHLDVGAEPPFCDHVGRLETIAADLERIARHTGVAFPVLGRMNATGDAPYADAFSERARRIVARRYGEDIETFGYRFEP